MTFAFIFSDVGFGEWFVLLAVILVVVGPKRLPETARKFGSWYAKFRRAADSFKRQLMDMDTEFTRTMDQAEQQVNEAMDQAEREMSEAVSVPEEGLQAYDNRSGEPDGAGVESGEPVKGEEGGEDGAHQES